MALVVGVVMEMMVVPLAEFMTESVFDAVSEVLNSAFDENACQCK